jgi:hypothetical protein
MPEKPKDKPPAEKTATDVDISEEKNEVTERHILYLQQYLDTDSEYFSFDKDTYDATHIKERELHVRAAFTEEQLEKRKVKVPTLKKDLHSVGLPTNRGSSFMTRQGKPRQRMIEVMKQSIEKIVYSSQMTFRVDAILFMLRMAGTIDSVLPFLKALEKNGILRHFTYTIPKFSLVLRNLQSKIFKELAESIVTMNVLSLDPECGTPLLVRIWMHKKERIRQVKRINHATDISSLMEFVIATFRTTQELTKIEVLNSATFAKIDVDNIVNGVIKDINKLMDKGKDIDDVIPEITYKVGETSYKLTDRVMIGQLAKMVTMMGGETS